MILVGSKIIKESYDIKAIQNEFIMSKPDNIPTFIQIRGRAVRKNSHLGLPPDKRVVRIKIFTTCLPVKQETGVDKGAYKLSYEEEKYREKVASFQVIQKIEKVIHENAIDGIINHEKIKKNMIDDPLGPLDYEPKNIKKFNKEFDISELNLSTFNIHHAYKEVALIKTLIKRLFIEISSVWEYKDLFGAIRNPPHSYETEINTHLFTENNFLIAINQLIWNNSNKTVEPFIQRGTIGVQGNNVTGGGSISTGYIETIDGGGFGDLQTEFDSGYNAILGGKKNNVVYTDYGGETDTGDIVYNYISDTKSGGNGKATFNTSSVSQISSVIDHLYDTNDKVITLPGGQDSVIVPIKDDRSQYYILFPINYATSAPDIDIELPYRIVKQEEQKTINMNSFIQTKRIDFDYDDKKKLFFRKFADISIENMDNVVCEYGTTFHIKFIEECIEYVFNAWTSPTIEKSPYHEFYFKMLYYYDLMSLVMWAHTCKPRIFKDYAKYANPVRAKDIKLKALSKYEKRKEELIDISPEDNSDLATSGVINLLKSTYNKTSNAWIPEEFRKQYEETVQKSINMFSGRKKKSKSITKTNADLLPIGHYISKFPRIYNPDKGWDENPTYLQNEIDFKENNLIVGFDERSSTGVHIRFKIRNPIHNIKKYKDSRQTEKGTVCKSKSKEYLRTVAKKIDIVIPDKLNVEELCSLIRSKLIRLELKERIKKSNIKYFYFHYEQRPEMR
jgi:hypothetical protein